MASPDAILSQYWQLITTNQGVQMPPYWSLGFHLCRYNYQNDTNLMRIINRTIAGRFPYVSRELLFYFLSSDFCSHFAEVIINMNFQLAFDISYLYSLALIIRKRNG